MRDPDEAPSSGFSLAQCFPLQLSVDSTNGWKFSLSLNFQLIFKKIFKANLHNPNFSKAATVKL